MIIVGLRGRLGNQMFQYAFAQKAARQLRTFFLLKPIYQNELTEYFKLDIITRVLFSKYICKRYIEYVFNKIKKRKVIEQNGWQSEVEVKNNVEYNGFFQSELFFQKNKRILQQKFKIKNKWQEQFVEKYNDLFTNNKTIVIHIRRTDYIDFGSEEFGGVNLCLPMSYYNKCLDLIPNIEDYKIICISDDLSFAKENLLGPKNILFESNTAIVDFQLMLNADILIIANSSFAWWAAFLNKKEAKVVYSPKYWLGFKVNKEYPSSITAKGFTPVRVN